MPCLFTISEKQSDPHAQSITWSFLAPLKVLTVAEPVEFEFTSNDYPADGEVEPCACSDYADLLLLLQANLTQANGEPFDAREKILLDLRAAVAELVMEDRLNDRVEILEWLAMLQWELDDCWGYPAYESRWNIFDEVAEDLALIVKQRRRELGIDQPPMDSDKSLGETPSEGTMSMRQWVKSALERGKELLWW